MRSDTHGNGLNWRVKDAVFPVAPAAAWLKRGRRVRTARAKFIEFFLVPDVPWALFLAQITTLAIAMSTPLSVITAGLVFLGLCVAFFLVLWLALINCNPYPAGYTVFDQLRKMTRALPSQAVTRATDLSQLRYPLIFKPSLCSTNSSGVRLISSEKQARAYMAATREAVVCAQVFHPGEEYTIMWERWPWKPRGEVVAVYWRRKIHPRGEFHPLSGAGTPKVTLGANDLRTPQLVRAVEEMITGMPNVYCTRFDVRADSPEAMARGEFWVMESNGCIGVPGGTLTHALVTHWPRRMITGLYNIFTHEHASIHPRVLVRRIHRFAECGGWDFRICDAF